MELTKILGIFLDNAIEGALESNEKQPVLAFIRAEHCLCIQIQNSLDSRFLLCRKGCIVNQEHIVSAKHESRRPVTDS